MSTTTSTRTTTPAESTSPTTEPADATVGAGFSVDADTVWGEVFVAFSVPERSCIRDAVDEELLESVLDRPVLESSEVPEEWEVSIFSCLAPQTARALFLSFMISGMEDDEDLDMDLTEEEMSCLREWVAGVDVGAAVSALADEDPAMAAELVSGMFSCLTDLVLSMMVSEMGMDGVAFSEEEMSCLREWVVGFDMGALITGFEGEDPSVLGELVSGLLGCVPDVFLSVMLEEAGIELGELTEEEASCLREWMADADFAALFAGDPGAIWALVPDLVECVPDLLDVPPGPGTSLTLAFDDATAIAIDEEAQGQLDEPYESDLFVFAAVQGDLYQIDVALGTLSDSVVALYDADETQLAYNDDHEGSPASRILWVAPNTGSYYVEVASYGDGTGSYTLTIAATNIVDDHADTIAEATPVITGQTVPGTADHPNDIDLFVFDAVQGDLYQIDVALGTLSDSVVALYDADNTQLAFNDDYEDSSGSRIFWEAPNTGSYYVEVTSYGDGTGSYTLTIAEATPVITGQAVPGMTDHPNDVDLFVFDAVQGDLYQIDVALGTLSDSVVALYDADNTQLAFNDDYEDSSGSRIFWEAPNTGSYYVEVTSYGDGTGSYTLTIAATNIVDDHADTIAEATSVMAGGAVLGAVDYPGDIDLFVFDAVQRELYQIDVALGTLSDSVVGVYDADETPLAFNDDYEGSQASRIFWEAPSSGSYYVAVASWGDGTGSYTLTIIVR